MSKQDIIIKIAKVTRLTGTIKHDIDVYGKVNFSLYVPELLYIDKWMEDIYSYFLNDLSSGLDKLITNMRFNDAIENYIKNHRKNIRPSILKVFDNYFFISNKLFSLCERNNIERKGLYVNLIEPLANKQIAELLDRAVDANILDNNYQPKSEVKTLHLRIIAYAISYICKFKHPYILFEEQWERKEKMRINTCYIPIYKTEEDKLVMALYPEVDFSKLDSQHKMAVFYTIQDVEEVNIMYNDLIKYRYIAQDTSLDTFKGIVGKAVFSRPVEWLKTQCQLAYFIYFAFKKYNTRDLWVKGECCFHIKGESLPKKSILSGYRYIKRNGLIDKYDLRLKAICDKFNHIEITVPLNNGVLIQKSKYAFYSTKPENKKKEMYSSLLAGGYIAPDTTYATFRGIFEEIEFTQPVVWMQKKISLIYFIYLVFKKENPNDLWAKCVYCFRLHGNKYLKRDNLAATKITQMKINTPYNIELKRIAEEYNHDINNEASTKKDT